MALVLCGVVLAIWLIGFTIAPGPLEAINAIVPLAIAIATGVSLLFAGIALYLIKSRRGKPEVWALTSYGLTFLTMLALIVMTTGIVSPFLPLLIITTIFAGVFDAKAVIPVGVIIIGLIVYQMITQPIGRFEMALISVCMLLPVAIGYLFWRERTGKITLKSEETLSELQKEFSNASAKSAIVINTISDGVAIVDQKGIIQLFNPAAASITGWKISDVTELDYRSVFKLFDATEHELADNDNPVTEVLATNKMVERDDIFLETNSQKRIQIHLHITPISEMDGVIVTFRDITKEKKEEREQAEFISTASHEMRTPIAIIEGYIGMLLNPNTATVDARAMEYATKAHESAKQLGHLFQDLLDVTKADDHRMPTNMTLIDAAAMAKQVTADFQPQAAAKGLALEYDAGPGMQPVYVIYADQNQLLEILQNIVDNAIKYTPSGSVTVKVNGDDNRVRFNVTDTGIGIPAEDAGHIFQKFYRVDNSDTREIGGTGLGLYLVKKLTENMGGQIGVESELGQGSTFWVEFDRLSRDEAMRKAAEIKTRQQKETGADNQG